MTVLRGADIAVVERDGVHWLEWPIFDRRVVHAVVTTRHGGVSTGPYTALNLGLHVGDDPALVVENRRRAASLIGLTLDDLVFCRQAHGREVVVVGADDRGRGVRDEESAISSADALVTTAPGVALVVMVADCVPLVLHDPVQGVLACVHAGWRGTVARVAQAAIDVMRGLGTDPRDLMVGIGPAIPALRYQVGSEVADAARDAFGARTRDVVVPDGTGRWHFDLWTANRLTLLDAGVRAPNVALSNVGTDDRRFFSDRAVRPCGRFAAIAALAHSSEPR